MQCNCNNKRSQLKTLSCTLCLHSLSLTMKWILLFFLAICAELEQFFFPVFSHWMSYQSTVHARSFSMDPAVSHSSLCCLSSNSDMQCDASNLSMFFFLFFFFTLNVLSGHVLHAISFFSKGLNFQRLLCTFLNLDLSLRWDDSMGCNTCSNLYSNHEQTFLFSIVCDGNLGIGRTNFLLNLMILGVLCYLSQWADCDREVIA